MTRRKVAVVIALVALGVVGFYAAQVLAAPDWLKFAASLPVWAAALIVNDTVQDRTVTTGSIDEAIETLHRGTR